MLTRKKDGAMRTKSRPSKAPVALVAGLALLLIAAAAPAQDAVPDWNDTADPLQAAIGLHYGKIGGHGLAFRLPLKWWLYLQAAGGLWHTTDREQHNLGGELNYILRQDRTLRLYLAAGGGWFYDYEKTGNVGGVDVWEEDSHWNYGFGVGIELLRGRRFAIQLEGNFMHNGDTGETKVTPQAGIYYYW